MHSIIEVADSSIACVATAGLDDSADEFDTMSGWLNVELIWMDPLVQRQ